MMIELSQIPPRRALRMHRNLLLVLAMALGCVNVAQAESADPETAARAVMTEFLDAFNAMDPERWANTLQFPHVRLAGGTVAVYPTKAEFVKEMDLKAFAASSGWHHSTWDDMRVIQISPTKVHIAVVFSRFRADGSLIASFDSLYVIELVDGHWGVRARSSFAP